jgi:hypothetical protein
MIVKKYRVAIHLDRQDDEKGLSHPKNPLLKTLPVDKEIMENANWKKILHEQRYLRIVPEGLTDEELEEFGAHLADVCYKLAKKYRDEDLKKDSVLYSVDEADEIAPQSGDLDPRISRLVTSGRKKGAEFIMATQRPQKIHETILSQSDYGCYFGFKSDRDIKKVQDSTSFNADRLQGMEMYKVIVENDDSGNIKQIDTRDLTRKRPHISKDDGVADEALDSLF